MIMAKTKRVYETWKGSNTFFLCGRLIFGPDVRSLFATIILILVPAVIFCVFVSCHFLTHYVHHRGYAIMVIAIVYTFYVLVLLLLTSGRDPGILPRNLYPPELDEDNIDLASSPGEWGGGQTPRSRLPRTKDVIVNGVTVKTKYCDTCMLYRPPRCSHCSICNNCVLRFDHHCPWVGQCIGHRNYRFFFMFVGSTTVLCIYVFAFCGVYIRVLMSEEGNRSVTNAMARSPAAVVLMVYTFVSVWFVGGLTLFHLYLIGTNQTTYENFRYGYDNKVNPYNQGLLRNFCEIFCTPVATSRNKFRSRALESPLPQGPKGVTKKADLDVESNVLGTAEDSGEENVNVGRQGGRINYNSKSEFGVEMVNEFDVNLSEPRIRPANYVAYNVYSRWKNNHDHDRGSGEITVPDMLAAAEGNYTRRNNTGNERGRDKRHQRAVMARHKGRRFSPTHDTNNYATSPLNAPNMKVGRRRDPSGKLTISGDNLAALKNSPIAYQPFVKINATPPPYNNSIVHEIHEKTYIKNDGGGDNIQVFEELPAAPDNPQSGTRAVKEMISVSDVIVQKREKPVSVASQFSQYYESNGGGESLRGDLINHGGTNGNGFDLGSLANSMRGEATSLDDVVDVPMSVDLNNVSHTRKYRFRFHSF